MLLYYNLEVLCYLEVKCVWPIVITLYYEFFRLWLPTTYNYEFLDPDNFTRICSNIVSRCLYNPVGVQCTLAPLQTLHRLVVRVRRRRRLPGRRRRGHLPDRTLRWLFVTLRVSSSVSVSVGLLVYLGVTNVVFLAFLSFLMYCYMSNFFYFAPLYILLQLALAISVFFINRCA